MSPEERIRQLEHRLHEAEATLWAISRGEVDALVVDIGDGRRIVTLPGADESYRRVIERMQQGTATLTSDGTILYGNRQLATLLECPVDELAGTNLTDYLAGGASRLLGLLQAAIHQEQRDEFSLQRKRGDPVAVEFSLSAVEIDGHVRICVIARDLTEERLHAQVRELAHTLEQRVAERTALAEQRAAQLRHIAGKLVHAEQQERRRIAQTLHDHLQQLLVAAKFKSSMSRNAVAQDAAAARYLRDVERLLDDAIEASRDLSVDLSPPVLHESGLTEALRWLARRLRMQHGLTVTVRCTGREATLAEPLREFLFQSARELLFNAVKHAACPQAWLDLDWRADAHVELCIRDDGVGFDLREIDAGNMQGSGLANIRQRVQFWGGEIELDAAEGRGCDVRLRIPMFDQDGALGPASIRPPVLHGPPPAQCSLPEQAPDPIRILIADDHAILRDGLAGLLRQSGFDVVGEAGDGQQAIDLAIALRPQVVLMDISMPHVNGIDATRAICTRLPDTRVIGLSMHDDTNFAVAMRSAGAVRLLTKGSPSDLLVDVIRASIDSERASA